jgi:NADH-quinone oxidoreductase chain G
MSYYNKLEKNNYNNPNSQDYDLIQITIDDREIYVPQGSTILDATDILKIKIPKFCYHGELEVAGNCRMCIVEVVGIPKPMPACALPLTNNIKIYTDSPLVRKARENSLEFLLKNHPLDCPVCDQAGECDLQDESWNFGTDCSRSQDQKRSVQNKEFGPLVRTEITRCIHCTRCVRFITEVAGEESLGTLTRGVNTEIGTYIEQNLNNELSGNLTDLCPVGALTSKHPIVNSRYRPSELDHFLSIDPLDPLGSSVKVDYKNSDLIRITPVKNERLNGEWIGDKGRYCIDAFYLDRFVNTYYTRDHYYQEYDQDGTFSKVEITNPFFFSETLKGLGRHFSEGAGYEYKNKFNNEFKIGIILGDGVDILTALKVENLFKNFQSNRLEQNKIFKATLHNSPNLTLPQSDILNIDQIVDSDFIFLLGTDVKKECPVLNAKIIKYYNQGNIKDLLYLGPKTKNTLPVINLGHTLNDENELIRLFTEYQLNNKSILESIKIAKNPIIILGDAILNHPRSKQIINFLESIDMKFFAGEGEHSLKSNRLLHTLHPSITAAARKVHNYTDSLEDALNSDIVVCVNCGDNFDLESYRSKILMEFLNNQDRTEDRNLYDHNDGRPTPRYVFIGSNLKVEHSSQFDVIIPHETILTTDGIHINTVGDLLKITVPNSLKVFPTLNFLDQHYLITHSQNLVDHKGYYPFTNEDLVNIEKKTNAIHKMHNITFNIKDTFTYKDTKGMLIIKDSNFFKESYTNYSGENYTLVSPIQDYYLSDQFCRSSLVLQTASKTFNK